MILHKSNLKIRDAQPTDIEELCDLINEIIQVGGTTAQETPFSKESFEKHFINGNNNLSCYVAIDELDNITGFQAMKIHPDLPNRWLDIATFARLTNKVRGVGTALFIKSKFFAERFNIAAINATIRADNEGGLAYYDKMGFKNYTKIEGKPLSDGTPVDRICKKYMINKNTSDS